MKFEIKSWYDGKILFSLETTSFKLCVEAAIKAKANLRSANLSYADLRSANLRYADLRSANLSSADLSSANLSYADLRSANLRYADLRSANLSSADLSSANLRSANLSSADLSSANLSYADLRSADLRYADLSSANLSYADLSSADLSSADLSSANLSSADLRSANLQNTKNMVKLMGVEVGNYYWKRFEEGLNNQGYQYKVGLNKLRKGEKFASDERITCDCPAFHFASRSWCAVNYPQRPLEARIRIPKGANINEPWATDGKASADMIEILQVFDVKTGKNVTRKYR